MKVPKAVLDQTTAHIEPRNMKHTAPYGRSDYIMLLPLLRAYVGLTAHLCCPYTVLLSPLLALYAGWWGYMAFASVCIIITALSLVKLHGVYQLEMRRKRVQPGFFHKGTQWSSEVVSRFQMSLGPYMHTWWLWSGDLLTLIPFLLFNTHLPDVTYTRRWLKTDDGEYIALDWAFPEGGFSPQRPVLLILHGLNGGSRLKALTSL